MKVYSRALNPELLSFWYEHATAGRIGLIHVDFVGAKVINWAERYVTLSGLPSRWAHVFMFAGSRNGVPMIFESDVNVPLPGFRQKVDGPQENLVYKWCHPLIDHAAVADTGLSESEFAVVEKAARELMNGEYTYRYSELAETLVAMVKRDLTYRGPLHREDSMHCGHFLREILRAAGRDSFGPNISSENTVPEHFAQVFPIVAEWRGPKP